MPTSKNKLDKPKLNKPKSDKLTSTPSKYSSDFIDKLNNATYDTLVEYNYLTQKRLEKLILDAKDTYYNNTSLLIIDDLTFDYLIDILQEKYPKSKVLDQVGTNSTPSSLNKVTLPYYLGSMDKVKPGSRSLNLWFNKYTQGPYLVSEKLDGLSGLLVMSLNNDTNKLTSKLYSRGNGNVGQDITHLIPFLKFNKDTNDSLTSRYDTIKRYMNTNNINDHLAIRGEIIITKDTFNKKYSKSYPKSRSLVSSVVNSKSEAFTEQNIRNRAKDIDFVSYQLVYPEYKAVDQFTHLSTKLSLKTAYNKTFTSLTGDSCQSLLLEFKGNSNYDIDGIIITDSSKVYSNPVSGNPKHSVAFKMPLEESQTKDTIVEYVEYNVSKNSILKPRIKYQPVIIGGDKLEYTSGFNAKYIKDNKLGPGSRISIIKSGDVIPYIYKILSPSMSGTWQQPDKKWHWNSNNVEAIIDNMDDLPMEKVMLQFFNQFDIEGLKEGVIVRLLDAGFNTLNDILRLKEELLLDVEGFQIKSSKKLVSQIRDKIVNVEHPLYKIMVASNCFPNFGIKKIKLITNNYSVADILDNKITVSSLVNINGLGSVTSKEFLEYLPVFLNWLKGHSIIKIDMKDNLVTASSNDDDSVYDSFIDGKNIVFTGFRNKQLEAYITDNKGNIQTGISSTTNLLVAKDVNENSSKIKKAVDKGIDIMDVDSFISMLSNYTS
jgi:DNA ligase (NAD+)